MNPSPAIEVYRLVKTFCMKFKPGGDVSTGIEPAISDIGPGRFRPVVVVECISRIRGMLVLSQRNLANR
jgi:hypothetical protein